MFFLTTAMIVASVLVVSGCTKASPEKAVPLTSPKRASARNTTTVAPSPTTSISKMRRREVSVTKDCVVRIAENPEVFDTRLGWKPCADGPSGCREVPIELASDAFNGSRRLSGVMADGAVTLVTSISLPGPINRQAVGRLDGAPVLVIDQPQATDCFPEVSEVSRDGILIQVSYDSASGYCSRAFLWVPFGPDQVGDRVAARLLRSELPNFIGEAVLRVGERVAVAAAGGPVRWFDPEGEKWSVVEGTDNGWSCCFESHGDYFSYMVESIPERLMAARIGAPAHEMRPVLEGGGTSPVSIDRGRAVWAEGRGRDKNNHYETIALWTGEISSDLRIENARVVNVLPTEVMPRPRFHDGVVFVSMVNRDDVAQHLVIRVADGETRSLVAPKGRTVSRLLWVTKDEIAVQIGPGYNDVGRSSIRRIPIAALPPAPFPRNLEQPSQRR